MNIFQKLSKCEGFKFSGIAYWLKALKILVPVLHKIAISTKSELGNPVL